MVDILAAITVVILMALIVVEVEEEEWQAESRRKDRNAIHVMVEAMVAMVVATSPE